MPAADVSRALEGPAEELGTRLLALVEDQWFERKSIRVAAQRLAETEIGMANADGGVIVVGLYGGRVEGTSAAPKALNDLMQAAIDHATPPVRAPYRLLPCVNSRGEDDHLLVFELEPSDTVHTNKKDDVFLRVGDETRRLTFHQRQELLYDKGQASFEARPLLGARLEAVDEQLLQNYADRLGHPEPVRLLAARGLSDGSVLTAAGWLLFAEHPQSKFPSAHVRVVRFKGRERGVGARQQLLSDVRIEGPIPRLLLQARTEVQNVQPTRRALGRGGRFEDIALVPEDAWLEGVVNAVVHRSYSLSGDHIRVEVFDDRIEIESPGRFPGLVNLDDPLRTTRFARNPRIARVCSDLRFGQEFGEGIRRMFEEMRLAGLNDPIYRQTSGSVRLTLSSDPVDRQLDARLPDETRAIVLALRESGRLSTGEIASLLDVSRPTASSKLTALRDAGVVTWVGKSPRDPRAYWRLPQ